MTKRTPVAKRLGRPPDVDSAETRERLLAGARKAFARHGFDATTNKQIADAAGITSGAIYHYYESKAELYAAVFEQVQVHVCESFQDAIDRYPTLTSRFGAILDGSVVMNQVDPSVHAFLVGIASETQRHPELRAQVRRIRAVPTALVARMVDEAVARGELAADVPPQAVVDLLNAVLFGLARFSNQTSDAERHAAAIEMLKRFLNGTLMR